MFSFRLKRIVATVSLLIVLAAGMSGAVDQSRAAEPKTASPAPLPTLVRSAQSGAWSAPATWEGGQVPGSDIRVQVRPGHTIVYDRMSDQPIRSIHVAGTLRFAADRDTRLDVGLIKIQPGEDASENGFDCDMHMKEPRPGEPRPALEVGTPTQPIAANHTALIRLVPVAGLDRESCPAIICCGGQMDFHGTPLPRTWVKLGATAKKGDAAITLAEPVPGWRVGDRVIVTATRFFRSSEARVPRTGMGCASEKTIRALDNTRLTLDGPLEEDHLGTGEFRTEVANLSRNVVIESGDPAQERGHTMYHRYSAGSISYAEFRHLGKPGVLGRYPIHYHLVGDTMRGSSVIGASVWDSGNRWVTIHGTNYLVVRDCVGYLSKGHGFYLEDGTEVYNVLDRNLAVQAYATKPLPKQALPFDKNDSAGFWWANCLNTFTRNVACGNERYGYRFEARRLNNFDPNLAIQQPDGSSKRVDIRTLPFVRFEDNECHHNGTYGINIGEGVDRVGPDHQHPLVMRNTKIWGEGYSFRPQSPSMLVENMRIGAAAYGVYHPNYDHHVYRNLHISNQSGESFNRGHDDYSVQYGPLAVDGLTFDNCGRCTNDTGMPMIQISDDNPSGAAVSHFRNVKVINYGSGTHRVLVNRGGGNRPEPTTEKGVPVYLHDWFGPGRHAKIVSSRTRELSRDGLDYRKEFPLTGDESRVAEVKEVAFPKLLDPIDDLPPATVITYVHRSGGKVIVRGTTSDNGTVKRVAVNGHEVRSVGANFAEWEVTLEAGATELKLEARAEDAAGNTEKKPHVLTVKLAR
jgi:hypothetical protein